MPAVTVILSPASTNTTKSNGTLSEEVIPSSNTLNSVLVVVPSVIFILPFELPATELGYIVPKSLK